MCSRCEACVCCSYSTCLPSMQVFTCTFLHIFHPAQCHAHLRLLSQHLLWETCLSLNHPPVGSGLWGTVLTQCVLEYNWDLPLVLGRGNRNMLIEDSCFVASALLPRSVFSLWPYLSDAKSCHISSPALWQSHSFVPYYCVFWQLLEFRIEISLLPDLTLSCPEPPLISAWIPVCAIQQGEGGNEEIEDEVWRCLLSAAHHFIDSMSVGSYIEVAPSNFSYSD